MHQSFSSLLQNWKARVAGYEEAKKLFDTADENSPVFNRYQSLLKGMLGDANVVALEKGLDAVISFISNAPTKVGANAGIAQVRMCCYVCILSLLQYIIACMLIIKLIGKADVSA